MHVLLSITFDPSEFCPSIYVNTRIPVKNVSVDKNIIDQTSDLVCAYKLQSAFYEANGTEGLISLKKTVEYIQKNHPERYSN